jgi:hypothetical protein
LREIYEELYGLLRRRRGEPEFWHPLKDLLREVVESAAESQRRGARAPAELLTSSGVDQLVDELRDALSADARLTCSDFTRTLSTAVLGGFLLLGLAVSGCGGGGKDGDDAGASDTVPPTCSWQVDPDLERVIAESTLSTDAKSQLCLCFSGLSYDWTTGLTDLFAKASPEEISKILGSLLSCCRLGGIYDRDGSEITRPSTDDLAKVGEGRGYKLCEPVPIYKGVSFPD